MPALAGEPTASGVSAMEHEGVLFDLDGVLYEGDAPVPGAAEAVTWFQECEIPHKSRRGSHPDSTRCGATLAATARVRAHCALRSSGDRQRVC